MGTTSAMEMSDRILTKLCLHIIVFQEISGVKTVKPFIRHRNGAQRLCILPCYGIADSQRSIHGSDVSYMENDSKEGGVL